MKWDLGRPYKRLVRIGLLNFGRTIRTPFRKGNHGTIPHCKLDFEFKLKVAPLSTLSNWVNEITKWVPEFTVLLYHGNQEERRILRKENFHKFPARPSDPKKKIPKCPITCVVTSFEISLRDKRHLLNIFFKYIVVDEAHRLKNFNCKLVRNLKKFTTENRLLLTGTPLQNNCKF
jgi:ATP-dependent DNA helicase